MRFLQLKIRSRLGGAMIEYLMMIILVSAVVVPILVSEFGEPFLKTMGNERQKMVNFFAQTPRNRQKPPVPASWFSQELPAQPESEEIQTGEPMGESQDLQSGEIRAGQNIRAEGIKEGGNLSGGQAINSGQVGAGGAIGGSNQGGGAAGGDDFFSTPPTPGVTPGKTESNETSSSRRQGSRGSSLVASDNRPVESIDRAERSAQKKESGKKEESQLLAEKKSSLLAAQQEVREQQKKGQFDWWLLIKVLIALGIIALLFLILLGNSRRTN